MTNKRGGIIGRMLIPVVLFALVFAFSCAARAEIPALAAGEMPEIALTEEGTSFLLTPATNGLYSVYLLPSDDAQAHAELMQNGELLAQGDGSLRLFSARLVAGTEYVLTVSGSGTARLDVARETLSRSFDQPLELTDGYAKMIARPGDVHWYSLSAQEASAALTVAEPESAGLQLETMLFHANGRLLAQSDVLPSGAAALSAVLEPESRYLLRVSAKDSAYGKYSLSLRTSDNLRAAQAVSLSEEEIVLEGWCDAAIEASVDADACALIHLDSSAPDVAPVFQDGTLQGRVPGESVITAYAFGGATAVCRARVLHVPVESVHVEAETPVMKVGDVQRMTVTILPENASDRRLTFVVDNESVLSVDSGGVLRAVGEGTARIVAITGEDSFTDMVYVAVEPAGRRYRALLIGEQNYASTVDQVRPGSIRSVESLAKLFAASDFDGERYAVSTLMDAPRDEVIGALRTAFADASDQDLSVVYITCHGFYRAGMTFFVMADGSVLSAADLAQELARIPGEVVLLADCCGSGGMIGSGGTTDDLLDGITSVFDGLSAQPTLFAGRIRIIASARPDQDSYRISFTDESGMATVFARALCDAAGWSIDRDAPGPMSADADFNGDITFDELGRYMHRRVQWYLSLTGGYVQNVCYFPEGQDTVIISNE